MSYHEGIVENLHILHLESRTKVKCSDFSALPESNTKLLTSFMTTTLLLVLDYNRPNIVF